MSINPISGSSATQYLVNQQTERRQDDGGVLGVAAQTLGLSTTELAGQLQSGQTLADIAEAQGVSREDLAGALSATLPPGTADPDSTVNSLLDQVGPPRPPQGPPPGPPPFSSLSSAGSTTGVLSGVLTDDQQDTLDSLSSLLNTDSQSLLATLQSGTSLSSLIQDSEISAGTLASVIQNGLLFDTRA